MKNTKNMENIVSYRDCVSNDLVIGVGS